MFLSALILSLKGQVKFKKKIYFTLFLKNWTLILIYQSKYIQ